MARVPLVETGRRSSERDLEKRLNLLTGLVILQILLLLVLVGLQILPPQNGVTSGERRGAGEQHEPGSIPAPGDDPGEEQSPGSEVHSNTESADYPPEVTTARPTRIEVLNGCGVTGLAGRFADLLRDEGYDIRDTRNADHHDYNKSLILDRTSIYGEAERLAALLGLDTEQVIRRGDQDLVDVDLTLILGEDYRTLKLQP